MDLLGVDLHPLSDCVAAASQNSFYFPGFISSFSYFQKTSNVLLMHPSTVKVNGDRLFQVVIVLVCFLVLGEL